MRNNLARMRGVATAAAVIRQSLKEQEASNKSIRDQITPLWSKPEKDGVVADLSEQLAHGKKNVRVYQTALHELKKSYRDYNRQYDYSQMMTRFI